MSWTALLESYNSQKPSCYISLKQGYLPNGHCLDHLILTTLQRDTRIGLPLNSYCLPTPLLFWQLVSMPQLISLQSSLGNTNPKPTVSGRWENFLRRPRLYLISIDLISNPQDLTSRPHFFMCLRRQEDMPSISVSCLTNELASIHWRAIILSNQVIVHIIKANVSNHCRFNWCIRHPSLGSTILLIYSLKTKERPL